MNGMLIPYIDSTLTFVHALFGPGRFVYKDLSDVPVLAKEAIRGKERVRS